MENNKKKKYFLLFIFPISPVIFFSYFKCLTKWFKESTSTHVTVHLIEYPGFNSMRHNYFEGTITLSTYEYGIFKPLVRVVSSDIQ